MWKKATLALCLSLLVLSVGAQTRLLTPEEFLPYHYGEQFSEHSQIVDYFRQAAANSDRIKLVEFGRTYQQRPQILAFVSTPENLQRLEEIRQNNLRNAGQLEGRADNANPVALVWLGFSVHGNEAAGAEASMSVLYELADPANAEAAEWLKNTVVLIEPCENPDGLSRYVSWYRQASPAIPDPNPVAREHAEPWPGGRVNHYLFDLNRDWVWAAQVETQNRLKMYNDWLPHVVADLHEQYYDSPYFFPPAAPPFHTYLSKWQSDFQTEVGKNNAKYFDKNGWLYFTKEVFDLFFPSYGDTYPSFNGAIGMTYEQGGHSRAGRAIQLPNGDTLSLADRIERHRTTALSTVEISSKNAALLVQNFAGFYEKSKSDPPGPYKTYIVRAENPPQKIRAFTELLDRHHIRYGLAGRESRSLAGYDYSTGKETKFDIAENDLIVSAYQSKGLLTQALLDPEPTLADSNTYDITAWSLLQSHGLDAYAAEQRVDYLEEYRPAPAALPESAPAAYAWLAPWNSMQSARFLSDILKNGVVARYAESAFAIEGKTWPAGTLLITRADNRKIEGWGEKIQQAASKFAVPLTSVGTGWVEAGRDFGSETMRLIKKPSVLALSGEKTYSNEFGQVWFYFDREIEYPATIVDADRLSRIELKNFDVLVLPEGRFNFDEATLDKLNDWVSAGGRLLAIGSANLSLSAKKGFNLQRSSEDKDPESSWDEAGWIASDHRTALYKDRTANYIASHNPGAIVRVKMDVSHPLAFGLRDYYFSLKTGGLRFDLVKDAWNVGYLEENFLTEGFIGYRLKKKLGNTAVFAVQNKGRGKVIYLIDNPLFRSIWEDGKLLFSNAVFF